MGILFIKFFRKDLKKLKYYTDLLKKHNYWDTRPMLSDYK